ncbi:MAG TPA: Uma2 family endonuclease [Bryobacteraceae bacterium]|nr:Uma2 family endonuclease [Bryobacteraceae bacterium]
MTVATPTYVSMDEYLSTSYEPEVDYVDGTLEDRNVGEWDHSSIQFRVIQLLMAVGKGLFIRPQLRIKISPTRCRVPDISVYESNPNERVPTVPPLLVVEVLSPEDRTYRLMRKLRDFHRSGANTFGC